MTTTYRLFIEADIGQVTISGPTVITFDATMALGDGANCTMDMVADGVNTPSFTGMTEHGSSSGYSNISGVRNLLNAWVRNGVVYYAISAARSATQGSFTAEASESALVSTTGASQVRVTLTPHASKFTLIKLFQRNAHGDMNPLGFIYAHRGKARSVLFDLESDSTHVWWEQAGRYLAQTTTGIPNTYGTLAYPEQMGAPITVEIVKCP